DDFGREKNEEVRSGVALVAIVEKGPQNRDISKQRYPLPGVGKGVRDNAADDDSLVVSHADGGLRGPLGGGRRSLLTGSDRGEGSRHLCYLGEYIQIHQAVFVDVGFHLELDPHV